MRITKLKLENYRGFASLELDLHERVTVLVGVNGSGKTSILDALAAAGGVAARILIQNVPKPAARDMRIGTPKGTIEVHGYAPENSTKIPLSATWSLPELEIRRQTGLSIDKEKRLNGPVPLFLYYRVERHAVDVTPGSINPRAWDPAQARQDGLHAQLGRFEQLFQWFREREDLENELRRDDPEYLDPQLIAVRRALEKMLPGYENPRVRRPRFGSSELLTTDKPVLAITKGNTELSFDQLSEGERTMAALVCDIARRLAIANPRSDKPLEGTGVVLIDEIDLHLHPAWQVRAIPSLLETFPNLQFVVTTHSPMVINQVATESVRLLEDFQVVEQLPPTHGRDPNALYSDIFNVPLRPTEIEKELDEISRLIDDEDYENGRARLEALRRKLGDDPAIVHLDAMLHVLED